jgi:hypothetical protein
MRWLAGRMDATWYYICDPALRMTNIPNPEDTGNMMCSGFCLTMGRGLGYTP